MDKSGHEMWSNSLYSWQVIVSKNPWNVYPCSDEETADDLPQDTEHVGGRVRTSNYDVTTHLIQYLILPGILNYSLLVRVSSFPGGSGGRDSDCNAGDLGFILGWKDPLEKGMATHWSIQAEEPVAFSPWGGKESDMTVQLTLHFRCKIFWMQCSIFITSLSPGLI